jgi:cytochrome P450
MSCPHLKRIGTVSGHVVSPSPSAATVAPTRNPGGGTGAVPAVNASALTKVGDEGMFVNEAGEPDFPSGLKLMAKKIPADAGLGYYTSYRQDGDGNQTEAQVVLCTRPEFIEEIMADNTHHYLWGGIEPASVAFFGARVMFVLEDQEWSDLRRALRPVLLPENLPMCFPDVVATANKLVEVLGRFTEKQEIVDVHLAHQCYHLQAVSKVLYNTKLPTLDKYPQKHTVHKSFNLMLEELGRRAFHPDVFVQFNYTARTEDNQLWAENRDIIHENVLNSLRPRLTGEEKCPVGGDGDLLQQLITAHKKEHPKMTLAKTEEHLGANLVELLFAGYNTVVNTMGAALYLLSTNPEKLQKARVQVDSLVGKKDLSFEAVEQMTYLDLVMNETLRLYSPTPAIARKLDKDTKLGEVICPAGTDVMIPMCAIHFDPTYWENPDAFNPERFDEPYRRCSWMPFSDGPRRCLGQHYARMLFKICIAQHIRNFDYEALPGHRFKTHFNGFGSMIYDDRMNEAALPMRIRKRQ